MMKIKFAQWEMHQSHKLRPSLVAYDLIGSKTELEARVAVH